MKAFVEHRAEELRQAKADNEALQLELNQTNQSLMDLNNRWKQLHAQWVQSQTRNRELQRDLNRIKKDSENLHKVGDTLEMRLTRSTTETEEHKNKRLAAKHELMTVLRTLEAERELNSKLRDSLKFTFTPKALSQQQLLHEGLEDFETQLLKLSQRLGRQLPPSTNSMAPAEDMTDHSESEVTADSGNSGSADTSKPSRSDTEIQNLIAKLEYETQRVSQGIMVLTGNIERMHMVLDASGNRSCYTVLGELLTTGTVRSGVATAPPSAEETTSMTGTGPSRRLAAIRSDRYAQVPPAAPG
jgi:chromosome segregation ATPase